MKIASKSADVCIKSTYPKFKYHFKEANVPIEIQKEHTEKILLNSDFYESDKAVKVVKKPVKKSVKKISWSEELEENFTKEEIVKIIESYKTKGDLLEDISKTEFIFQGSIGEKLKEVFIR